MSTFVQSSATDLVAILDNDNLRQLFVASRPMRVGVRESRKATQFAVEDGSTRSDHVVVAPVEITLDLFIADDVARNGYEELRQAWNENRLVTVQTMVASYPNMLITDLPHDEVPQMAGAVMMPIRLMEWRTFQPQFGALPPQSVRNVAQSSTVQAGQKQTIQADSQNTQRSSTLYRILN